MCRVIGDTEKERYAALEDKVKRAFCRRFMDEEGKILSDTQSLYAMAYKFGVIDAQTAKKHLVRTIEENGGKLTTGFLGIRFLLPSLCELGRADIAYAMLTSTEFPGWGYSVKNGATTIWEHWDSYTVERGIRAGMNSFNHYSFGSCTEWMYEYCLGIRPSPHGGFESARFAPFFDPSGKITHAEGHYDAPKGRITAAWRREGDGFVYTVTLPEGMPCAFDFAERHTAEEAHEGNTHRFLLK